MQWDAIGAVGETVGALAVLITLIAIYFQIRQNQVLERESAQRNLLDQCRDYFNHLSSDQELFDDVRECLHEYSTADPFKKQRFFAWSFDLLFIVEQAYYQRREGLINEASFHGFTNGMLAVIKCPGGLQWWHDARQIVGKDVGDYLQERIDGGLKEIPRWDEIVPHMKKPPQL